jgi:predicted SAM-dependent methyltransferase
LARIHGPRGTVTATSSKLQVGSGERLVPGWMNVDIYGTDPLVDLGSGVLPFHDQVFDAIASQHVIEHLDLHEELIPLLRELRRVSKPGAEIWLSCPDMEIICRAYLEDKARALVEDRIRTATVETGLNDQPPQHFINKIFVQEGEHKNLFDLELLDWTLRQAGFVNCRRVTPEEFLARFPEFPPHYADMLSIYVCAEAPAPV